ncbi:MAG: cytochrome c [Pseudomonadota bacterium]
MKTIASTLLMVSMAGGVAHAADAPTDTGEHVYKTICQGCHMPEGQGATGAGTYPKLASNPRLVSWQYAAMTILLGRHGMPAFGGVPDVEPAVAKMAGALTDEQIAAVVNYVRTHFGNDFKDKATVKEVNALPHPGGKGTGHAG